RADLVTGVQTCALPISTCQHGRNIIAQVRFFQRDIPAFRAAVEQVVAMNPRDTDAVGVMGLMLMYVGDFERGASLVRRVMDLNQIGRASCREWVEDVGE